MTDIWIQGKRVEVSDEAADEILRLRFENAELRADIERFKSNNRYQRGYADGSCDVGKENEELRADIERKTKALATLESKVESITTWLEKNQGDVWRRGLWDAINQSILAGDVAK